MSHFIRKTAIPCGFGMLTKPVAPFFGQPACIYIMLQLRRLQLVFRRQLLYYLIPQMLTRTIRMNLSRRRAILIPAWGNILTVISARHLGHMRVLLLITHFDKLIVRPRWSGIVRSRLRIRTCVLVLSIAVAHDTTCEKS